MIFFQRHKGPEKGYCRICGQYNKLSKDHVPPKSCSNTGVYIIKDFYGSKLSIKANNGVTFRSICEKCNNEGLGPYDAELAKFARHTKAFLQARASGMSFDTGYKVFISSRAIVRAIAGHMLAAHDLPDKLSTELEHSKYAYLSAFHQLYEGANLPKLTIGVWIHNFPTVNICPSARVSVPFSKEDPCMFSLLSFFPLGFLIIDRRYNPQTIPLHRMRTDIEVMEIDLTKLKFGTPKYPIDNLQREIVALNRNHIYTAEKWPMIFY